MIAPTKLPAIDILRPRTDGNSVLATIATVAQLPVASVANYAAMYTESSVDPLRIRKLLQITTHQGWRGPNLMCFRRLAQIIDSDLLRVAIVLPPRRRWFHLVSRFWHCIFIDGSVVHDPDVDAPIRVDDYARSSWRVIATFEPSDPVWLRALRERRDYPLKPGSSIIDDLYNLKW